MSADEDSIPTSGEPETEEISEISDSEGTALSAGIGKLIDAEVRYSVDSRSDNPLRRAVGGLLLDHLRRRRISGWVLWGLGLASGLIMFALTVFDLATFSSSKDVAPLILKSLGTGGGLAAGAWGQKLKR